MSRLAQFMQQVAAQTYPEPRTTGHDHITEQVMPLVMAHVPKGHILDVGCGHGPALKVFKDLGRWAYGIALNPYDVEACRELGFDVEVCDQNAMPDNWDHYYSLVWARHVLEHSIAPYFTLHEFNRVLQPGGILYVEVPAPDTSCHHESNQNHYSVMGLEMWKNLIFRAGFELLEIREINLTTGAGPDVYFSIIAKKP